MESFETQAIAPREFPETTSDPLLLYHGHTIERGPGLPRRGAGGCAAAKAPYARLDGVEVRTRSAARRLTAAWPGLSGEIVGIERERFESRYCGHSHLL